MIPVNDSQFFSFVSFASRPNITSWWHGKPIPDLNSGQTSEAWLSNLLIFYECYFKRCWSGYLLVVLWRNEAFWNSSYQANFHGTCKCIRNLWTVWKGKTGIYARGNFFVLSLLWSKEKILCYLECSFRTLGQ